MILLSGIFCEIFAKGFSLPEVCCIIKFRTILPKIWLYDILGGKYVRFKVCQRKS